MIREAALFASAVVAASAGSPVYSIAYSPDGALVATGGADNMLRLWTPGSGVPRQSFGGHQVPLTVVAFSPDGKFLASASLDGTVRINDLAGALQRQLDAPKSRGLAFQPGADPVLAVAGQDAVRFWNYSTGRLLRTLERGGVKIGPLAYRPDGKALATGGDDGSVRLWNMSTGAMLLNFDAGSPVTSVAASATHVAAACQDGRVKLVAPDREIELSGPGAAMNTVAFSPDGARVAAAGADNAIRIWDVRSGALLKTLEGHTRVVLSIAFSPDGVSMASTGEDGAVRYWKPLP